MIVPLGEHTTHLRLWQLPIGLYCCRYTIHIPVVATILLPLPSLTKKFAPTCLGRYQMPEGGLQAEVGPKPKLNARGCVTKEEEGNSPLQQHVQQINFL